MSVGVTTASVEAVMTMIGQVGWHDVIGDGRVLLVTSITQAVPDVRCAADSRVPFLEAAGGQNARIRIASHTTVGVSSVASREGVLRVVEAREGNASCAAVSVLVRVRDSDLLETTQMLGSSFRSVDSGSILGNADKILAEVAMVAMALIIVLHPEAVVVVPGVLVPT
jgi:hypothetical protein